MRPRVLLVDSEPAVLEEFRTGFHTKYDFVVAQSAAEALAYLATDAEFAIIVSDFRMPEIDGAELLSRVRREYPLIVRIMLTAVNDVQMAASAVNAGGVFKFLLKPCLHHELEQALASGLAHHRTLTAERALALQDRLLQIGNRTAFDQALVRTHKLAGRYLRSYGVAMADLDHFEPYNASQGRDAGDESLKSVAGAIRRAVRGSDEIFRYGGEEIVLVFPDTDLRGVQTACERVRKSVELLKIPYPGHEPPFITVSLGAAVFDPNKPIEPAEVLERTLRALRHSKESGRNRLSLSTQ